ncbi:hydrolase [Photobacterium sp.]|uniref:hydrolase n=1 Tax=Photobacterium sp. TaxID=660 RepID=UPI00299E8082|nr:hydrolase [Photobacterium sp.]MDX1302077.1 hydrolase [Photobacterium sp.]
MLDTTNTALLIIDVQGKLAQIMDEKEALFGNLETMVKGANILGLPTLWVEQLPDKLGTTISQITDNIELQKPVVKSTFSAYRNPEFAAALKATDCKNVLVTGIEAHICVYQTAIDLHDAGYHVEVISDAVSSRTPQNKQLALDKMQHAGINLTCTEMALFELQSIAEGERFKQMLKIIK